MSTPNILQRVGNWIKRAFLGKRLPDDVRVEKPAARVWKAFFSKKSAVVALVVLIALFAFVFIAPAFVPLDINATDALQQNLPPDHSFLSVPKSLKNAVADIDGYASFTVGRDENGKAYVWGGSKNTLQKNDLKDIPSVVKEQGVTHIAAGKDHALAITNGGNIVGWGDNSCGQYGTQAVLNAIPMPTFLADGVANESVRKLVCGYQTSAIVFNDGRAYLWGNKNIVQNLPTMSNLTDVADLAFVASAAVAVRTDGSVFTGDSTLFLSGVSIRNGRQNNLNAYLLGRKVRAVAASNKCIALLLEDNDVVVSGVAENREDVFPTLLSGEYFTQIDGGSRHFVGVTNLGNVYAWGDNTYGQCNLSGTAARVFAGSLQSYSVDERGVLQNAVGLKGYLMGTDGRGRDVFARIVHGGRMTLTIGAVAVVVSSTIAIIVGATAGYFGGFVDTLLMRVTEIFSSIPFLPFAMLLSQIIKYYNISEGMRIFIVMLILGALSWTGLARMIRGQVLSEREKEYVTAAKAIGVKPRSVAFRHVLPNVVSVILVSMTLDFAGCLLTESSLSYLGFGVQQPQPTWGNMLTGCNNSTIIQNYWWQWLFPSLFLSLAVICINVVGDALRDALDPKKER